MSQNTSSAVMQQRNEPHDSLDFFPTPPWATRALIEHVLIGDQHTRETLAAAYCWDPCCGEGHMTRPLSEYFGSVTASDVHDYGFGNVRDFLEIARPGKVTDWTIANPPFRLAREFIERALEVSAVGAAMLVRTTFIEGVDRYLELFRNRQPSILAPFSERVIMAKGVLRDPGVMYLDEATGTMKRPSTATAYCWLVWEHSPALPGVTRVRWIPPCRKKLESPGDYA